MSWVNDLSSALGIPAGAATVAAAMYTACKAAEKVARPEALKDISRSLKSPSWSQSRSLRPYIILDVFEWMFGEKHLSWKCFTRSILSSIVFILSILVAISLKKITVSAGLEMFIFVAPYYGIINVLPTAITVFLVVFIPFIMLGIIPDYLALWKTRVLLKISVLKNLLIISVMLALLSIFISVSSYITYYVSLTVMDMKWDDALGSAIELAIINLVSIFYFQSEGIQLSGIFMISTMLTSVWIVIVLLSTFVLRIIAPLDRFTVWFFDVDKNPLQAIGIVAGTLVLLGSLIWSLIAGRLSG